MTHVWQFAGGRSGGHGPDFRNEMIRIGILEDRDGSARCRYGTAADRLLRLASADFADLPVRLRALADLPPGRLRLVEEAAFAAAPAGPR